MVYLNYFLILRELWFMAKRNVRQSRVTRRAPKKRLRKRILYIFIPLFIILLAGSSYAAHLYMKAGAAADKAYEDDGREKSDLRDEIVDPKYDHVSILLLGVDENDKRKEREVSRTDAMVLATLNKTEKSVKLLSIPRDSLVYIPEVGYEDKINHAHAFGGTEATIETVENLLDIPVDYYVKLNFNAFVEVIDALGGISVEVPYEFTESNSNDEKNTIHLLPGEQVLNGEEALALARTRKKDSDYMRGQRQLEIIDSIIDKSASIGSILKYGDVIDALGDNMSTNMSFTDMKSFFSYASEGKDLRVEKFSLEGYDYWPENIYYWQVDDEALEHTKNKLKAHLELTSYVDSNQSEYYNAESGE